MLRYYLSLLSFILSRIKLDKPSVMRCCESYLILFCRLQVWLLQQHNLTRFKISSGWLHQVFYSASVVLSYLSVSDFCVWKVSIASVTVNAG